jgi:nickel-dependent lactate racemase
VEIDSKRELVIASCGGLPWDINLIQAHKTMEMAAQACTPGGTIVLLAQCSDGLGRSDFLKWFAPQDSRALENLLREAYEVNGQTAWSLRTKAETFHIFLISDLPEDIVSQMGLRPTHTLADALIGKDEVEGFILPNGAAMLPVVAA